MLSHEIWMVYNYSCEMRLIPHEKVLMSAGNKKNELSIRIEAMAMSCSTCEIKMNSGFSKFKEKI